jgi:hypothetical protein
MTDELVHLNALRSDIEFEAKAVRHTTEAWRDAKRRSAAFPGTFYGRQLASAVYQMYDKTTWARQVCGRIGLDSTAREIGVSLKTFYATIPEAKISVIRQALVAHAGEALAGGPASAPFGGVVGFTTSSTQTASLSFRIGSDTQYVELFDEAVLVAVQFLEQAVLSALDNAIAQIADNERGPT